MSAIHTDNILLHAFKHHYQTVVAFILQHRNAPMEDLLPALKTLGASQFDLYNGPLAVAEISDAVVKGLLEVGCATRAAYQEWVVANGGYRTMLLPDGSEWTLRFVEKDEFVHVHPSRYAVNTVRIKANAMKSVVCYLLLEKERGEVMDVVRLNQYRKEYLQLSPVAGVGGNDEMEKVYALLVAGMRG